MSKKSSRPSLKLQAKQNTLQLTSLLDQMKDGVEFESLVGHKTFSVDVASEIRRSLEEIKAHRNRPAICYLANVINQNLQASIAIDNTDDLPFSEMISTVPEHEKNLDIILVTPGGSAEQVAKFVDKLRPRFDQVAFILPYMAMSAGTIFAMSGNDVIMGPNSYIGPTDPQVKNKDGVYVPAQALLALILTVQERGERLISEGNNPLWSDLYILRQLDGKDIGNAISASRYSTELVEEYLYNYKFRDWLQHSDGRTVEDQEKRDRANQIAQGLCSHEKWKTHSRGITRDIAWNECKIKITSSESIAGLESALRRFWAMIYWLFENTTMYKAFISKEYAIFRNAPTKS